MRYVFRRRLFLLVGVLTLCLFFLVAGLDSAGRPEDAQALAGPMRVLIIPMYLVWLLWTMALVAVAGPQGLPGLLGTIVSGIGLVTGLAPYALVDYLLDQWRRVATRKLANRDKPS